MEYVELDKSAFDIFMKLLDRSNISCHYCNVMINKDNFGLIQSNRNVCNNILCLYHHVQDEEELKKQKSGDKK